MEVLNTFLWLQPDLGPGPALGVFLTPDPTPQDGQGRPRGAERHWATALTHLATRWHRGGAPSFPLFFFSNPNSTEHVHVRCGFQGHGDHFGDHVVGNNSFVFLKCITASCSAGGWWPHNPAPPALCLVGSQCSSTFIRGISEQSWEGTQRSLSPFPGATHSSASHP